MVNLAILIFTLIIFDAADLIMKNFPILLIRITKPFPLLFVIVFVQGFQEKEKKLNLFLGYGQ